MKLAIFATTIAAAGAFTPASTQRTSTAINAALSNLDDLKALAAKSNPVLKVRTTGVIYNSFYDTDAYIVNSISSSLNKCWLHIRKNCCTNLQH